MAQHKNPLERDPQQGGTVPDPQTNPGATSIGADAGVFPDTPPTARVAPSDEASGRDEQRSATIEQAEQDDGLLPPPVAYRPDTVVRAVSPEARLEMERGNAFRNIAGFTKGHNAPTLDRSRMPYSTEDLDEHLRTAPRGIFPNTPGGAGARPLSAQRNVFIDEVARLGHFPSRQEAEKWTRAVFNALRQRAVECDAAIASELASLVRVGEAPEVQIEEMMWSGDFVERFCRMATLLQTWNRRAFYEQIAEEAGETRDDPWVEAAVYAFFGALKRMLGPDADRAVGSLGEVQEVWERA
ncbi:DUF2267 domain-containing protein [Kallotenue papyrolyticum]|uniref:DUF2267 domain-containing protein n=1 Tax=Kallotenue papyrolyticum TaxID=1325125 RepID=UPI000492AC13|nr:DUF2267 domain-containing protein [Kallotenue papyrolyticum]